MTTEFLKNLNDALAGKVYIEHPNDQFMSYYKTQIEIEKFKQFVCIPTKELVVIGPGLFLESHDDYAKDFNIEHIKKLTNLILEFSKKIKFHPLILPFPCQSSILYRYRNIYGRFIEDYVPATDTILGRFDFLIQKLD